MRVMKKIYLSLMLLFSCLLFTSCVTSQPAEQQTVSIYSEVEPELLQALEVKYNLMHKQKIRIVTVKAEEHPDLFLASKAFLQTAEDEIPLATFSTTESDRVDPAFKSVNDKWIGLFYDPLVMLVNQEFSRKTGQKNILHWQDILHLQDVRVVMDNLSDSATGREHLAAVASHFGEDDFFTYLTLLKPHILRYTKFPITSIRLTATGEADIAIIQRSAIFKYLQEDFPAYIMAPEEGSATILYGMGIAKDSVKRKHIRKFVNWLLKSPEAGTALLASRSGYLLLFPRGINGRAVDKNKLWLNYKYKSKEALDELNHSWLSNIRLAS